MTSTKPIAADEGNRLFYALGDSSLGRLLVVHDREGAIRGLLPGEDDEALLAEGRRRFSADLVPSLGHRGHTLLERIRRALATPERPPSLPLAPQGTPFQQAVWAAMQQVPPGRTISYGDLAQAIGRPQAVRAVAAACGANPIAILIPCHRIVRKDGALGGYRWGLGRKIALLRSEGALAEVPRGVRPRVEPTR